MTHLPIPACLAVSLLLIGSPAARAQEPVRTRPNMQAIAAALGVQCNYCHAAAQETPSRLDYKSDANPKKRIARVMIAMTADINATIQSAMLKPADETMTVACVTCHRGVADPRPLSEILTRALQDGNPAAAAATYRDLRQRYFGQDVYDFSERALVSIGQRLVERDPDAAIALLQMNLEFYPRSAESYFMMATAYTRKLRDADAIECLEKALEINPEHSVARGFLVQLQQYRPKARK